jgi:phosphoribosyl-AMP cyclohydrolase
MENTLDNTFNAVSWNDNGLVAVIAQDYQSKQVLMLAWMNREALQKTIELQQAVYFSRSRQKIWHKGESSGHFQQVKEIRLDCDGDTLLLLVEQIGGIACHTGRAHCLFRRYSEQQGWETIEPVVKDPSDIYS